MTLWSRQAPLAAPAESQVETWTYSPAGKEPKSFAIRVRTGKPLDVIGLKNTTLVDLRDYAAMLAKTASRLYGRADDLKRVTECRCCRANTGHAKIVLQIFGVAYVRCPNCGHVFVASQRSEQSVNDVFRESEDHSKIYIDPETVEIRLREVVAPKADWTLDIYRDAVGARPTSCIDVGAGGGHFVEGMHRRRIAATGFELSQSSRTFAERAFGVTLINRDFLETEPTSADLITMWGLLEYTPEPRRFLAQARRTLIPGRGLLVVEVPRFDALSTVAQAENPENVARHMDPTSHLNCFSDASLATALVEEGFRPVAAWYFGMDAYELIIQAAARMDDERVIRCMAEMIPALQATCDAGRQCDDLIMAAVPV